MNIDRTTSKSAASIVLAVSVLSFCACSAVAPVMEELDENTGVTVSYSQPPLTFSRETTAVTTDARDFVQLGAIEINRSGAYQCFLWLGMWIPVEYRDGFDSIVVFADDEPLRLDIVGTSPQAIGASDHVYKKAATFSLHAYYPVTVEQIRVLANAVDIRVQTSGSAPLRFELWDEQRAARQSLAEFERHVSP